MTAALALVGAAVGWCLTVVAHRLPRGESLVSPGPRCPGCHTAIRPWHNVPVLGWLLLRGRCAACGERISMRYPLVEAASAVLFGAVVARFGLDREVWIALLTVIVLTPITVIDLEHRIIPNRITGPAAIAAVALAAIADPSSLPERLGLGAAAFAAFLIVALVSPAGMGMGDVKLAGLLGLLLGAGVAVALLVALVAGTLAGAAIMARKGVRAGRKTAIPFGPFLVLGGLVALFAGPSLLDLYLHAS